MYYPKLICSPITDNPPCVKVIIKLVISVEICTHRAPYYSVRVPNLFVPDGEFIKIVIKPNHPVPNSNPYKGVVISNPEKDFCLFYIGLNKELFGALKAHALE